MEGTEKAVKNYVHKLSFRVRDTLLAARYGFNARNIWSVWKGLAFAWITWAVFVYLGFYAAGDSISDRFSSSVLCPLPDALFTSSLPAVILLVAGTLLAVYIFMATALKVSRLTFEQLRGDQFFSERDASKCLRKNRKSIILTPVTILSGILAGIAVLYLFGAIGRIPMIGSYLMAVLALPSWILGLFLVLAAAALFLSVFLVPVIAATTQGDTFECLFELFSVVTSKPMLLVRGAITGSAMRILAMLLLVLFAWSSLQLAGHSLDRASGSTGTASAIEGGFSQAAPSLVPFYSSIFSPVSSTQNLDSSWSGVPGLIVSAAGVSIMLFLVAYWFSSCISMWTIIYLGARYSRDGEDLLLRAEEEEYREFRRIYGSTDRGGDRKSK